MCQFQAWALGDLVPSFAHLLLCHHHEKDNSAGPLVQEDERHERQSLPSCPSDPQRKHSHPRCCGLSRATQQDPAQPGHQVAADP